MRILRDRVGNAARLNDVPCLTLKSGEPSGAVTKVEVNVIPAGGGVGAGVGFGAGVGVGVGVGAGVAVSSMLFSLATVAPWSPPFGPPVIR